MNTPVYLDYNATTPMDPRVLEAMMPFFVERFGNAASRHHSLGCEAAGAVEKAREQVAAVIGADPREIIFTSGATEADNLAIQGVAMSEMYAAKGKHIVTVRTEHKAVLDTCGYLEQIGFEVTYLKVDAQGCIDLGELNDAITERTILVSIMHANNEIGVLHPIRRIGRICKDKRALFHTDATQSFGKEPIDVEADHIDLLSLSAHKTYGPKGIGALYLRRRKPRVRCAAMIHGGGHERGVRSGTLNVPGVVGLGAAAEIAGHQMTAETERVRRLRDALEEALLAGIESVRLNGHPTRRLASTLNVSFGGVDGEALMKAMPDLAVSASSACTSAAMQPSYVLAALGLSDELIRGSVRFSLGRFTTPEEVDYTIKRVTEEVNRVHRHA